MNKLNTLLSNIINHSAPLTLIFEYSDFFEDNSETIKSYAYLTNLGLSKPVRKALADAVKYGRPIRFELINVPYIQNPSYSRNESMYVYLEPLCLNGMVDQDFGPYHGIFKATYPSNQAVYSATLENAIQQQPISLDWGEVE